MKIKDLGRLYGCGEVDWLRVRNSSWMDARIAISTRISDRDSAVLLPNAERVARLMASGRLTSLGIGYRGRGLMVN